MMVYNYWTWTRNDFDEPLLIYIYADTGMLLPPEGVYIIPGDVEFKSNPDLTATPLPKNWEMVYLTNGH